jgi:hypothetical protein
MVTFEGLVGKFGVNNVAPYGACIIVPGDEFDPDWEVLLADQGCRFHFVELAGKAVTLVQKGTKLKDAGENSARALGVATPKVEKHPEERLKGPGTNLLAKVWSSDDEQKLLKRINALPGTIEQKCIRLSSEFIGRSPAAIHQKYVKLQRKIKESGRIGRPKKESMGSAEEPAVIPTSSVNLHPTRWTEPDDQLLIGLWNQKLNAVQMVGKFPGRNENSIKMRLARLKEKGLIKPRWKQKAKIPERKAEKEPNGPAESEPASTPVHTRTSTPTHAPIESPAKEDPVLTLLREIRDLLRPRDFSFDYYCRSCGESGSVSNSERIYEFCPVCGKSLVISNVEE